MKAAPPGLTPDPRQDPRINRSIDDEYAHADRLRASLLAGVFLTAGVVFGLLWIITTLNGAPLEPWQRRGLSAGAITGSGLGGLELLLRSQARRARGGRTRILLWYGSTVLEIGTITAAWLLASGPGMPMTYLSPGIAGFASLTVLSALRLDWRITAFTGILSAIASATLRLYLWADPAATVHGPQPFGGVGPLVIIGILTALVAEQARRRTFHAIEAIAAQQRLEREVTSMAEAERQRIGRDLHDGLGSRLRGLSLMAQGLARRVQAGQSVGAVELQELADLLGEGVDEVRRLARGLDPAPVEVGLPQALQGLADRTQAAGTSCTCLVEGEAGPVDRDTTLHLYHIAQEAVTNAIRHGQAPHVDIRLTVRAATIALDVRDDGSGIPVKHVEGLGQRAMRQRAALLDAILRIRNGPDGGTLVTCVVPRETAPEG